MRFTFDGGSPEKVPGARLELAANDLEGAAEDLPYRQQVVGLFAVDINGIGFRNRE